METLAEGVLKHTKTSTARSLNKRFNAQTMAAHVRCNSWYISVSSFGITTCNDQILRYVENVNHDG